MAGRERWEGKRTRRVATCNLLLDCLCDLFRIVPGRFIILSEYGLENAVEAYVKASPQASEDVFDQTLVWVISQKKI